MKIGIMADSHENMEMINKACTRFNEANVELVLHVGDIISPITAKEFKLLNSKFIGVFGNNDGEKRLLKERFREFSGELYESPYKLVVDNKKILLYHIPDFLPELIKAESFDLIIYGHTHKIDIKQGKTTVINPGECGGWLYGRSTVAILDTKDMSVELVDL